ncbi:hypothetical protein L9F63_020734, partial [Diploptera punctata]
HWNRLESLRTIVLSVSATVHNLPINFTSDFTVLVKKITRANCERHILARFHFPSYKGFPNYKLEFSHAVKTEEFPNSLA